MAQIVRYVDTDVVGGAGNGTSWEDAYSGLDDCETAEQTDLDTANNYITIYCRASSGTKDGYAVYFFGWTTSATDYIEVIGVDFPSDGIFDMTKYYIQQGDLCPLRIAEDFCYFRNLQLYVVEVGDGLIRLVIIDVLNNNARIDLDSCIVTGIMNLGGNSNMGLRNDANDSSININIYNCTIYDITVDSGFGCGIWSGSAATLNIYNTTVYNCEYGIRASGGIFNIYNCIVGASGGGSAYDFTSGGGTLNIDHCCSDSGDGTNPQTPLGSDWDNEMNDPDNGDFTILAGGNCVDNGTNNPSGGIYLDDIIGESRS